MGFWIWVTPTLGMLLNAFLESVNSASVERLWFASNKTKKQIGCNYKYIILVLLIIIYYLNKHRIDEVKAVNQQKSLVHIAGPITDLEVFYRNPRIK